MKKTLLAVAVWYFVFTNGAQIGPFATQTACEDYRAIVTNDPEFGGFSFPCFSTAARQ